jgi:hypothetical protein
MLAYDLEDISQYVEEFAAYAYRLHFYTFVPHTLGNESVQTPTPITKGVFYSVCTLLAGVTTCLPLGP